MINIIAREFLKPLIRRAGSMIGGALVGVGIAQEQAVQVETAAITILCVLADLILSKLERSARDE